MATSAGKRVAVFGLWATYPAESINGLIVSDRLFTFLFKETAPPAGVVFPADREAWARDGAGARRADGRATTAVKAYLPWLSHADYDKVADSDDPYSQPVSALRRILIDTTRLRRPRSLSGSASSIPTLPIVYFEGTDTIGHVFAPFAPPRQPQVVAAGLRALSRRARALLPRSSTSALGEYRRLAAASHGGVLMLASDHGFSVERRPADEALEQRDDDGARNGIAAKGIYLLWGNGVPRQAGHSGQGSVQQVCGDAAGAARAAAGPRRQRPIRSPGATAPNAPRVDYVASYHPAAAPARELARPSIATAREAEIARLHRRSGERHRSSQTAGRDAHRRLVQQRGRDSEGARQAAAGDRGVREGAGASIRNLSSALWNLSDVLYARGSDLDRSDELLVRAFGARPARRRQAGDRPRDRLPAQSATRPIAASRWWTPRSRANARDPELWLFRGRYRVDANDCARRAPRTSIEADRAGAGATRRRIGVRRRRADVRRRSRAAPAAPSRARSSSIPTSRRFANSCNHSGP